MGGRGTNIFPISVLSWNVNGCVLDRFHEIYLFTVAFVIKTAGEFRTWHVENRKREAFSVCLSRSDHITSCQWTRLQYKVIPGNAFYWHNTHNYKMQMNNWSHHIGCSQQRWAGLRGTWRSKYSDTQRPLRTQTALREKNRERYHPETTNEWGDDWSFLARVQGGWAGGNRL